ncbi:hypothetical protein ACHAXR_003833 [Thalassiosira sp. AJA248-18]
MLNGFRSSSSVRSCWGSELRHTATVAFFLDNGVPLEAIYDKCLESSKNPDTISMLQERQARSNEL